MDPLSFAASLIAITQAVSSIGQGIHAFRSLNNASTELLSLLNDLDSLQTVLGLLKDHIDSQSNASVQIPVDYPPAIQSLYLDLSETTTELNGLAARLLASSKGSNKKGLYHVSRISYLKEKSNIERLRHRSQVLQNNASSCLAAFNTLHGSQQRDLLLEKMTSIETSVTKISHHQDQRAVPQLDVDLELECIKNKYIETFDVLQQGLMKLDALQLSIAQAARGSNAKSITSNETEAYIPYVGAAKQSHTQRDAGRVYSASILSVQKCKSDCKCRCHKVLWAETPSFLQSALGTILLEYDGQSILYSRRCDNPICRAKSHSHIRFLYKFPLWWASRALMASLGWSTLTGLGASLWFRVPRMITFHGNDFTDLEALKQRFSRGELLPTDVEPNYGCNLLTAALNSGAYSFIPTLLQNGVDPRVPDLTGRTAVHLARQLRFMAPRMKLSESTKQMLLELIHFNADSEDGNELTGTSIIHDSILGISSYSLEECIFLQPSYINSMDSLGFTPLHWAAMGSNLDAVKTLAKFGADPNCRDRHDGQTPLHLTCNWNWYEATLELLDRGAIINVRDKMKFTPLHLSCRSVEITRLLLRRGADPHSTTVLKATPLNHLLYVPNQDLVGRETDKMVFQELAKAGADLDHKASDGYLPLFVATMLKPWLVPTFLKSGATVHSLDGKGKCILHMLVATTEAFGLDDIQATLFIGLDPDLQDHQGYSPLELMEHRIVGQTIRRGLGEPTLGELFFFTSLICEIRELNWEESLFLDTKTRFEEDGSHASMMRWIQQQKTRLQREPEARNITCHSLDMWWERQDMQSQANGDGKGDVEETEDEEFFEAD